MILYQLPSLFLYKSSKMTFARLVCDENGDKNRTFAASQSSQVFGFLVVIKSLAP